ncbi:hypothetical protein [Tautonia sociabilis]|uniref:Rieske domain-containing protein n=1 Tax=Tautonia sociabilis TaxID=2080755 RepID=A0A432MMC8_9BACT|nr:hypothetical protein [Tautonia sociabilis]RUL88440.1 hypothetical protein TsocGM_06920 [Tautonia sociabilis]
MAKRPSVSEIIAQVRASAPAPSGEEANRDDEPSPPPPRDDASALEEAVASPPSASTTSGEPPSSNRPLSLREKLAAARNRPAEGTPAPAQSEGDALESNESGGQVAEAPPSDRSRTLTESSAIAQDLPESEGSGAGKTAAAGEGAARSAGTPGQVAEAPPSDRPLSIKEKLAAARGRPAGEPRSGAERENVPAATTPRDTPEKPPAAGEAKEPAGRPLSIKEKLAAARGNAARAASAPAERPAALPSAPRTRKPLGELSDPVDLAAALREAAETIGSGSGTDRKGNEPGPEVSPKGDRRPRLERKVVLGGALAAIVVLLAIGGIVATAIIGRSEGRDFGAIVVGTAEEFPPESVDESFADDWGFWVVRSASYDGIEAIVALGPGAMPADCRPAWEPGERRFVSPCDGSRYGISGRAEGGPAGRSLVRFGIERDQGGMIRVDPARIYREELGQWADPGSFVRP